jgi:hypothetical protein
MKAQKKMSTAKLSVTMKLYRIFLEGLVLRSLSRKYGLVIALLKIGGSKIAQVRLVWKRDPNEKVNWSYGVYIREIGPVTVDS